MGQDDDSAMLQERIAGKSVIAIAEQYGCAITDVDAAIDRRLNYRLDNDMRLRAIKLDVARLEGLMQPFYERATKDRDVQAGTLCVKILERRALLLGLDQPVQSRVDVYQMPTQQQETRHDKIRRVFWELKHPGEPMPDGWPSSADDDDAPHPKRLNGDGADVDD